MAATYRSSTSTNTGATPAGSIVVTTPAGVQVNDTLIAVVGVDGGTGATINIPTGWTQLRSTTQGTNIRQHLYYRLANGQEAATYTWTFDTTRAASAAILAYSGANLFSPPATAPASSGTASTTITAATINSTYETGLVLQLITTRNTTAAANITPGTGYSEREDTCTSASPFINVQVEDQSRGLPMGGTTPNTSTSSQSAVFISCVIFLEDQRPAFNFLGVDEYAVGSLSSSSGSINLNSIVTTNYPNELLLLFCTINKDVATISSVTGGGLTWLNVGRANTNAGSTELWRAFAATPISLQSVSATFSASVVSANAMVVGFVGADISGTNGSGAIGAFATAASSSAAPTVSVTTTRANSWVWGATNAAGVTGAMNAGSGQTLIRNQNDTTNTALAWMQRQTALTGTSGTVVTINSTSPSTASCNTLAVEILPAQRKHLGALGVG